MTIEERDLRLIGALDEWLDALPHGRSPEDEAAALRAFLLRVRPGPRQQLALRLWREAAGFRDRPAVAVWGARAPQRITDLARLRFGEAADFSSAPGSDEALAAASGRTLAVLPIGEDRPWWGRLLARPRQRIVAALPDLSTLGPTAALVVAERQPGPSGQDETFWVTDAADPAARLERVLSELGAAARLLDAAGGLKLFALAGYFQAEDSRLAGAPGQLSGVVGWAPLPYDL